MYAKMFTPATSNQAEEAKKKKEGAGKVRVRVSKNPEGSTVEKSYKPDPQGSFPSSSGGVTKTVTSYDKEGKRKGLAKVKGRF